jgi:flagellar biosynthetic protein FliP
MVAVGLAQQSVAVPNVSVNFGSGKETGDVSTSLQILALLTILSVAPALLILTTAFSRIVIIFGFVRNALGTQTIPPNQVLVGLSLFLTFYVMGPTYTTIYDSALKPYMAGEMKFDEASERAQKPLRAFMLKNTYEKDLRLFIDVRGGETPTPENIPLTTLIPAFVISELKTAFIVGFYIFIPFVIIDLVVASGLMSMGMMMMPPTVVSLPAKILVFVLADGWSLLVSTILSGYR